MRTMRVRYAQHGGHVHCRVFTASHPEQTFAKVGELVFAEDEWLFIHSMLSAAGVQMLASSQEVGPLDIPSGTDTVILDDFPLESCAAAVLDGFFHSLQSEQISAEAAMARVLKTLGETQREHHLEQNSRGHLLPVPLRGKWEPQRFLKSGAIEMDALCSLLNGLQAVPK